MRYSILFAVFVGFATLAAGDPPASTAPAKSGDEPSASDVLNQLAPTAGERKRPAEPPASAVNPMNDAGEKPAAPPASPPPSAAEPRQEPTASDVLDTLRSRDGAAQPIVRPNLPGTVRPSTLSPDAIPKNAIVPVSTRLLPDGYRIVDRPGRLQREGDYWVFALESRSTKVVEAPLRLLPNRALEDMEITSAGGTQPLVFLVSGEITEYHGINYLIVQKMLVRPSLGNLR